MTNRTAFGLKGFLRVATHLRRIVAFGAACALPAAIVLAPTPASAQEWLKDRRYQEGAGIRAGDFELHPGIGAEVGYDSNFFLRTHKEDPRFQNGGPANPPREAGVIRVAPSITATTRHSGLRDEGGVPGPPPAVVFSGGVAATYREFLGAEEIRKQRNVSGGANLRLDLNNGRPIGFGIFASYDRLIQPAVVSDPNLAFNRSDVGLGAEVIAIPGGGTLDLRAGYQFRGAFFEESNGAPYTSITHEVGVRNRWRFRPRTALFHDTSLRFINYPNAARALNYLNDSTPLRTRFGVTGLLTDRFGVLLAAGYGATFFKETPPAAVGDARSQYDSINAQAEGTFYLSQGAGAGEPGQATLLLSTLSFGYVRDFQASLLGNYYESNKGYAKLVYFFGGRVLLSLSGSVEALGYPQPYYRDGAGNPVAVNGANGAPVGEFTNYRVGGVLFGEYRFTNQFGLNATFDYAQVISDTQLATGAGPAVPGATGDLFDLNWRRFQAYLGARYFW